MSESITLSLHDRLINWIISIFNDVLNSATAMPGTVVASSAFGGLCLWGYYIHKFYKSFDKDLISKDHFLAIFLMIFGLLFLPLIGIIIAGIYGINNTIAAWQVGLTTPVIISSTYISLTRNSNLGKYQQNFIPEQPDA
ncbi:hypothetical protein [Chromobacterium sphagni]|uniref:Transmembrane protein n=1 Tax=Chromobacterium sphagni TaxID=1903179 RepID=A0ABX3CGC7_9NEIS|nr:hypothetical protein [Chromobacterium sphagni]OHX21393.1 hypothetical protein BI344_02365 [Chromobacterium sphagni]